MSNGCNRRQILKSIGAACASLLLPPAQDAAQTSGVSGVSPQAEIAFASVSPHTLRLTLSPIQNGRPAELPDNSCLVRNNWSAATTIRSPFQHRTMNVAGFTIDVSPNPLGFAIKSPDGTTFQELKI